jgi:hypothetical protein
MICKPDTAEEAKNPTNMLQRTTWIDSLKSHGEKKSKTKRDAVIIEIINERINEGNDRGTRNKKQIKQW